MAWFKTGGNDKFFLDLEPAEYYSVSGYKRTLPYTISASSIISMLINCEGYNTLKLNNLRNIWLNKLEDDGSMTNIVSDSSSTTYSSINITGCKYIWLTHTGSTAHQVNVSLQ